MPQPSGSDLYLDALLTDMSVAYIQDDADMVATKAFPIVPVKIQTGKYPTYTKNDWMRDQMRRRAPATESAGGGWNTGSTQYSCDEFGLHKDIADQDRANASVAFDLERDATEWLTGQAKLAMEIQWATDYFATGIWATDKTGTTDFTKWSDVTSDPRLDVQAGQAAIKKSTGKLPNKLIVQFEVFQALQRHPDVKDAFKYTSSASITRQMMAGFFDVEQLLIAGAVKATNVEGETAVQAYVNSQSALLCYAAPRPGRYVESAGYTFLWEGISNLGQIARIDQFRMPELKSDRVEIGMGFDFKVVASDLGYFFNDAVD